MEKESQNKGNAGSGNPEHGGNGNSGGGNDKLVTLTIVVNTKPTDVTINENAPLKAAAEKALAQTHTTGRPLSDYELKLGDQVLDMDKKVRDYNLKDGDTLFLSLKAGNGGSR